MAEVLWLRPQLQLLHLRPRLWLLRLRLLQRHLHLQQWFLRWLRHPQPLPSLRLSPRLSNLTSWMPRN